MRPQVLLAGAIVGFLFSVPGRCDQTATNAPSAASPPPDLSPYEHWITGDILEHDGTLLFRTDKAVQGDNEKNLVVLGASRATMYTLIPAFEKAAEKHLRVRLYGVLLPFDGFPGPKQPLPNVEFIVWKFHLPSDPDNLSPADKIEISPLSPPPAPYTYKSFRVTTNGAPVSPSAPATNAP